MQLSAHPRRNSGFVISRYLANRHAAKESGHPVGWPPVKNAFEHGVGIAREPVCVSNFVLIRAELAEPSAHLQENS
jgi:hypothetical protein